MSFQADTRSLRQAITSFGSITAQVTHLVVGVSQGTHLVVGVSQGTHLLVGVSQGTHLAVGVSHSMLSWVLWLTRCVFPSQLEKGVSCQSSAPQGAQVQSCPLTASKQVSLVPVPGSGSGSGSGPSSCVCPCRRQQLWTSGCWEPVQHPAAALLVTSPVRTLRIGCCVTKIAR